MLLFGCSHSAPEGEHERNESHEPASARAHEAAARWLAMALGSREDSEHGVCPNLFDFDEWKKLWTDDVILEIVIRACAP